jgi:hypothetical protein
MNEVCIYKGIVSLSHEIVITLKAFTVKFNQYHKIPLCLCADSLENVCCLDDGKLKLRFCLHL